MFRLAEVMLVLYIMLEAHGVFDSKPVDIKS